MLTNIRINTKIQKTILSLVLVLSYLFVLSYEANAATLYFYPQNIELYEGENAIVDVRLNTEGEEVNALEINGGFSDNAVNINSIDTSNSFLQIFIENPFFESKSFLFVGGTPNGFSGDGIIGRLNIVGNLPGNSLLSFNNSSQVLANTGIGDKITLKFLESNISVFKKPADYIEISSRTNPDKNRWYNSEEINIHWELKKGAAYSYIITQDPTAVPDDIPDKPEGKLEWQGDISLSGLGDGIYYFIAKSVGSSTVSRYSILQDITPPEWIEISLNQGTLETDGKKFISFSAKDETSGIAGYEVQINGDSPQQVSPPTYIIPTSDYKEITISAYDRAGNVIEKTFKQEVAQDYSLWIGAIFLVIVVAILMFIIRLRNPVRDKK